MSCGTGKYEFTKVGKSLAFYKNTPTDEMHVLIPECTVIATPEGGTDNIILTVIDCKVTPSIINYVLDDTGVGTIKIDFTDIAYPVASSVADMVTKLNALIALEFPLSGGDADTVLRKRSSLDFEYDFS